MTRTLLASIALLMSCTFASAQEVPEPKMMFIRGGMLCNTEDELQTLLTGIHLSGGQYPSEIPEGCGRFVPRAPVPMMVTPLYWYETPSVSTLVARFYFAPQDWTQYGWVAYTPNPDYAPPTVEEPT